MQTKSFSWTSLKIKVSPKSAIHLILARFPDAVEDFFCWACSVIKQDYALLIKQAEVDSETFSILEKADIISMGIPAGPALLLMKKFKEKVLRQTSASVSNFIRTSNCPLMRL
jgi:hypothetical protein